MEGLTIRELETILSWASILQRYVKWMGSDSRLCLKILRLTKDLKHERYLKGKNATNTN